MPDDLTDDKLLAAAKAMSDNQVLVEDGVEGPPIYHRKDGSKWSPEVPEAPERS